MKTTTMCSFTHLPGEREGNGITVLSHCEIHVRGKSIPLKHIDHGLESSCLQEVTAKDLIHFPLCGDQMATEYLGVKGEGGGERKKKGEERRG